MTWTRRVHSQGVYYRHKAEGGLMKSPFLNHRNIPPVSPFGKDAAPGLRFFHGRASGRAGAGDGDRREIKNTAHRPWKISAFYVI